ncbi:MAG: helix-turn-helix transcriptional regulator [Actinomycetota bacterium]|nr:helix-turn-helix transcriptional regulator [Actinomycetota bacterium]
MPQPPRDEIDLGRVLAALADPMRRTVVATLATAPEGFEQHCSAFGLPVSKQTRTHHFRVLRESGLVSMTDRGNRVLTSLRRRDMEARFPGLLALVVADAAQDRQQDRSED